MSSVDTPAAGHPGRALFRAGAVGQLVVAGLHTLGHFRPPVEDEATRNLLTTMRGYRMDLGFGMNPSAFDVTESLSLSLSVLLAGLALVNLTVASGPVRVRPLALVNALVVAGLLVVYAVYEVAPPLLTLIPAFLFFLLAFIRGRAR